MEMVNIFVHLKKTYSRSKKLDIKNEFKLKYLTSYFLTWQSQKAATEIKVNEMVDFQCMAYLHVYLRMKRIYAGFHCPTSEKVTL